MAKNVHKVPKRQWQKWNKNEQAMFNRMWHGLGPMINPMATTMSQRDFNVLRWNACWYAAETMKTWRGWWGE